PTSCNMFGYNILNAKSHASVDESNSYLPQQLVKGANCAQFWVHFEISVPASYGLDINTEAGDILTGDVGGATNLVTQGGNIVTGQLSTNSVKGSERRGARAAANASATLKTEGGHIQVESAAGDLVAFTAGGHINTGYIHGEA